MILDGGTTSLQMVQHLPLELRATVVTHSPVVTVALAGHLQIEVLILDGRLSRHSMVNVGASVVEAAAQLRADLYLLGVTGVHADAGLTTGDFRRSRLQVRTAPPGGRDGGVGLTQQAGHGIAVQRGPLARTGRAGDACRHATSPA